MANSRSFVWTSCLLMVACLVSWLSAAGDKSASENDAKPSVYAPAKELAAQLNTFLQRISEDLSAEADYQEEQQGRLAKDASTIAALAMVLGQHDEAHDAKRSAAKVIKAARKLADHAADFKSATTALAELKAALETRDGGPIEWAPAADMSLLMKQVPIVNNNLRRNVTGKRFKQSAEASAGLCATLAAIAQVSRFDDVYCSTEEDKAKWDKVCVEMRDAAAEVLAAIRKQDQIAATAGLDKLVTTCDACHHDFRD